MDFRSERGSKSKLTFEPKDDTNPTWSPDGSRIAFSSDRRGHRDLYVKSSSGSSDDELLLASDTDKNVEAWSPDGRTLMYNTGVHELWTWSFDRRKAQLFFQGKLQAYNGSFSPDGKWWRMRRTKRDALRSISGRLRSPLAAREGSG